MRLKKLYELLDKTKLNPVRICTRVGLRPSSIDDWRKGISEPSAYELVLIAYYFGFEYDYFLEKNEVNSLEIMPPEIIKMWFKLDDEQQDETISFMLNLLSDEE